MSFRFLFSSFGAVIFNLEVCLSMSIATSLSTRSFSISCFVFCKSLISSPEFFSVLLRDSWTALIVATSKSKCLATLSIQLSTPWRWFLWAIHCSAMLNGSVHAPVKIKDIWWQLGPPEFITSPFDSSTLNKKYVWAFKSAGYLSTHRMWKIRILGLTLILLCQISTIAPHRWRERAVTANNNLNINDG